MQVVPPVKNGVNECWQPAVWSNENNHVANSYEKQKQGVLSGKTNETKKNKLLIVSCRPPATRVNDKVMIPQDEYPEINFVGLLIGPR